LERMIVLANTLDSLVNYCKQYGFVYQGSEIYGGLANSWDYGPLGVQLKNNLKKAWWDKFVANNPLNTGIDSGIILHSDTWLASGHVKGFQDPLLDCKECKSRFRADKLIETHSKGKVDADGWSHEAMMEYINTHKVNCPVCGNFNYTDIRQFNLMFKTYQGVLEDVKNLVYLRPETAQGIFLNFKNILRTSRKKIPFGIGQIGKSFRNEITPGNFIFRTREFEQMELEFFCIPGTELEWFNYWRTFSKQFLVDLGISEENIKLYDHPQEKLTFYSNATTDILYRYPWGFDEIWGIASRTDYDLKQHQEYSNESLEYFDPDTDQKYLPYVIEPSLGVERLLLALLNDSLSEELVESTGEMRTLLKLDKNLAPYQVAVLPLVKKYHQDKTDQVYNEVVQHVHAVYDDTGNIGKRYRRQDAIGTPYCVTIDNQTLEDDTVTVRERDSMEQVRVEVKNLVVYLQNQLKS